MGQPRIAQRSPIPVTVQAGKTYLWCACGLSSNQPFCDGSHKVTGFTPMAWTAGEDGRIFFCACKRSGTRPLCDGTHKRLVVE